MVPPASRAVLPGTPTLQLKKPLERAIHSGHPWVYRQAIQDHQATAGRDTVLLDRSGRFLARGLTDDGPIALRVWRSDNAPIDAALMALRLRDAHALRQRLIAEDTSAYRLVHGEGDRMPAVVCDQYNEFSVLRLDGSSVAPHLGALVQALESLGRVNVCLRTGRGAEKSLTSLTGAEPPETLRVQEHGMVLPVSLYHGQKTGLFLDHRESRRTVRTLARDLSVLNLFGYTGGFSIAAGLGGATHVTTVDVSAPALALAAEGWAINALSPARHGAVAEDAFTFLEDTPAGTHWDLIISDPPSFAPNERALAKAMAQYRRLHRACLARLAPGGFLLAASCSSHVTEEAFLSTLADAEREHRLQSGSRLRLQLIARAGPPADHPRIPAFREGDYLNVLIFRWT